MGRRTAAGGYSEEYRGGRLLHCHKATDKCTKRTKLVYKDPLSFHGNCWFARMGCLLEAERVEEARRTLITTQTNFVCGVSTPIDNDFSLLYLRNISRLAGNAGTPFET